MTIRDLRRTRPNAICIQIDMHKKPLIEHYQDFRDALLVWFERYQREMPWRNTDDPYRIWVSEVMLQQTQVKKVVDYYEKFVARFPSVQDLAAAPLQDVLKVWEGLGYYARARNLHKAAQVIVNELDAEIPLDYATFRKLPGVGDYSAAAVQSIAFNAPYAAVDGNIKRVLARLFLMDAPINDAKSAKLFQEKADALLDRNAPGLFNQAVMELGAMVCRPQSPTCLVCPVNAFCEAFDTMRQDEFPKRRASKPTPEHHLAVGVIYNSIGEVLLTQRQLDGLLGGLWEFPGGEIADSETAEAACVRTIAEVVNLSVRNVRYLTRVRHAFTHFKIVVDVFQCDYEAGEVALNGPRDAKWVTVAALRDYPLPRATHKFLDEL
ncbi:MAG: A/G-specific adenine glycosylase [Candidatus Poribacteria bacterium]|nr:A/G-specific adenine glycosylase [Candidatus Poribacteria bacterium]